jgi:hypothetical protein
MYSLVLLHLSRSLIGILLVNTCRRFCLVCKPSTPFQRTLQWHLHQRPSRDIKKWTIWALCPMSFHPYASCKAFPASSIWALMFSPPSGNQSNTFQRPILAAIVRIVLMLSKDTKTCYWVEIGKITSASELFPTLETQPVLAPRLEKKGLVTSMWSPLEAGPRDNLSGSHLPHWLYISALQSNRG